MSAAAPIVLILGAGPNIGQAVARAFIAKGYKAVLVSRKQNEGDSSSDQLNIAADLSNPDAVVSAFSKVKTVLGDHPSVVVHNAAAVTPSPPTDPLSLALADFTRSLNINTVSAFVAAQQAALGFAKLPSSASKTFIYTGNILNTTVIPPLLDLGVGKSATAHIIQTAATVYKDQGFKFYYADQRKPDGSPIFNVDGEAHADFYVGLAEGKSQGPWQQAFVKGEGYKVFPPA
ncbi:putative short-chain dehydrogenase [Dactylonectria estremocensis]|uniref:Short-chain dehydrogenase n=1 Tax=Dactylonectria estremocensis TaxID=1079267 RepID=A0A9P9E5T4_9HYPO|nr:putative short-chain dehydrogenase [Dactylonectria estremocensis]